MNRKSCFNDGSLCNRSYSETDSDEGSELYQNDCGTWKIIEDEKLKKLVQTIGDHDWHNISLYFNDKTEHQCYLRWRDHLSKHYMKDSWSIAEDNCIVDLVSQYGTSHWSFISKHLPGRTTKQCRERWFNELNPDTNKSGFGRSRNFANMGKIQQNTCEPPIKQRVRHISTPFSGYSTGSQQYSKPCDMEYPIEGGSVNYQCKTVYPVRASTSNRYDHSGELSTDSGHCPQAGSYMLFSNNQPNNLTPIKFSRLGTQSTGHARIDETSLSHVTHSGLIPLTSQILKPRILRRKRKSSRYEENKPPIVNDKVQIQLAEEDEIMSFTPITPNKTPVKSLPFSPSQFFNSPSGHRSSKAITSTPVCNMSSAISPKVTDPCTPTAKISIRTPTIASTIKENHPKTPTPFKNALADLERRSGIVRTENHTPTHIHDDLQDVIAEDSRVKTFQTNLSSRFGSFRLVRGANAVQQNLEKRLSDAEKLSTPGFNPETPSKSLFVDHSFQFSPPSDILKDTVSSCIADVTSLHANDVTTTPNSPMRNDTSSNQSLFKDLACCTNIDFFKKPGFKMIACGKTEDQLYMTSVAHLWMRANNS